jgi:antitoxin component of MazEF toxin-antitoxin module
MISMTKAPTRAKKVGGSIMVRLPKEIVQQEDIQEGEMIEVDVRKARKEWFGATPNVDPFTHEDELDSHE